MNTQQLFAALSEQSLRVKLRSDQSLQVIGDLSRLNGDMRTALRANRQLFLDLLGPEEVASRDVVKLGEDVFEFSIWSRSERLRSPIAIDTETELIDGVKIPRIALAGTRNESRSSLRVRRSVTKDGRSGSFLSFRQSRRSS